MFPHGWYVVHAGPQLEPGTTRTADLLDRTLTITREQSGGVIVTDATGHHLPVHETAGAVFAWWGPDSPDWQVGPFPELNDTRRWTPVHWLRSGVVRTTVENAQRDVVDNAHFEPVHGLRHASTTARPAGRYLDTVSQGIITLRRIGGPPLLAHLYLDGQLHGPGLLVYRTTITIGIQVHNLVFSAVTPVDGENSVFFAGVAVRKLPIPGVNGLVNRAAAKGILADYEADARFWASGRQRSPDAGEPTEDELRMFAMYEGWLAQYQEHDGVSVRVAERT
jgi:phenylpropionate dioxygenase-like ring-hydroxylating dioxygenase large terminal subunit